MDFIIKQAKIINPSSPFHNQTKDILVSDGIIKKIDDDISIENVKIFSHHNLHISMGWVDCGVNFGEPGFEENETIETGLRAAAKGGFTSVAMMPNTSPCIDNEVSVEYLKTKAKNNIVNLLPIGAITKNCEGKELSESYSMYKAGAIAFSDNKNTIENESILKTALLYLKNFDGLLISFANTNAISKGGQMNEGINSTKLGLKGIPNLSEELQLQRDISIAEYTDNKLHIHCISTKKSIEIIREAKAKGLKITCSTTPHHILLNDDKLYEFESKYKVLPPLRTKEDINALINGIKDGTIDMISSDHTPINIEQKKCEFEQAAFGTTGLESSFSATLKILKGKIDLDKIIALFSENPRKILNLDTPIIQEKSKAEFTLFTPNEKWIFIDKNIFSKSNNSIFLKEELYGKVLGISNKNDIKFWN